MSGGNARLSTWGGAKYINVYGSVAKLRMLSVNAGN